MSDLPELHPVQTPMRHRNEGAQISSLVTTRAYEVYEKLCGSQPALLDLKGRNCRGGFSTGELIAYLYARSFPEEEWADREREARHGLKNL